MILQQNIFEKLKASRKAKLKPDHFQHMHENTHKMKKHGLFILLLLLEVLDLQEWGKIIF